VTATVVKSKAQAARTWAERSSNKDTIVGTRTGSEADLRAKSMLGNTKSNRHRKTQEVEPDDTGRNNGHLTRGDLPSESAVEVSRGRSSEESR
jgi:hypothetical protein